MSEDDDDNWDDDNQRTEGNRVLFTFSWIGSDLCMLLFCCYFDADPKYD